MTGPRPADRLAADQKTRIDKTLLALPYPSMNMKLVRGASTAADGLSPRSPLTPCHRLAPATYAGDRLAACRPDRGLDDSQGSNRLKFGPRKSSDRTRERRFYTRGNGRNLAAIYFTTNRKTPTISMTGDIPLAPMLRELRFARRRPQRPACAGGRIPRRTDGRPADWMGGEPTGGLPCRRSRTGCPDICGRRGSDQAGRPLNRRPTSLNNSGASRLVSSAGSSCSRSAPSACLFSSR